jgi:hypothetical protein
MYNLVYAPRWDTDLLSQPVLTDSQRLEVLLKENLTWMDWRRLLSGHVTS